MLLTHHERVVHLAIICIYMSFSNHGQWDRWSVCLEFEAFDVQR